MGECTGNHDDFVLMRDRVMNMIVQQTIECQRSEVEVGLKMKVLILERSKRKCRVRKLVGRRWVVVCVYDRRVDYTVSQLNQSEEG